jgi:uncharacterized membrane protein
MSHPVIIVGSYDNRHRAEQDYEALTGRRAEIQGHRAYAVALVERSEAGKAKVVNVFEPGMEYGGIAGTVVGGLIGLLYPPLILVSAAAGLGVARTAAHLWHGVSRKDVAELGAALDAGEGAVLVLARDAPDDPSSVLPHSTSVAHRTMTHRHEDIEAITAELREAHDAAPASSN